MLEKCKRKRRSIKTVSQYLMVAAFHGFLILLWYIDNISRFDSMAIQDISSLIWKIPSNQSNVLDQRILAAVNETDTVSLKENEETVIDINELRRKLNVSDYMIELYNKSNGIILHQTKSEYYEVDELDYEKQASIKDEMIYGRRWKSFIINETELDKYLLPTEVQFSRRKGVNEKIVPIKDDNCTSICCIGSFITHPYYSLFNLTNRTSEDYMFRTWFTPAGGRKARSIVDALDLLIDIGEKKGRNLTHLVILGDSMGQQVLLHAICSIQRTLGAKIAKFNYAYADNHYEYKVPVFHYRPIFIAEVFIEINSPKDKNQNRMIKISFLKHYKIYKETKTKDINPIYLKLACGLSFTVNQHSENGKNLKIQLHNDQEPPVAVMITSGTHYNDPYEYAQVYNASMLAYQECERNGVEIIFRERPVQHFKYNYGGLWNKVIPKGSDYKELPGRAIPFEKSNYCAPIIVNNVSQLNTHHQLLMEIEYFRDSINIINGNEVEICNYESNQGKVDYLSINSALSQYWRSHKKRDCTHLLYSPGAFLSYADWLYTTVYRWTLPVGTCSKIPDAMFLQGPEGLHVGKRDRYPIEMLPTTDDYMKRYVITPYETFLTSFLVRRRNSKYKS